MVRTSDKFNYGSDIFTAVFPHIARGLGISRRFFMAPNLVSFQPIAMGVIWRDFFKLQDRESSSGFCFRGRPLMKSKCHTVEALVFFLRN